MQAWQVKKYGIPKSVICGRLPDFFMQPRRRRSLAVGTALRNFVAKKTRSQKSTDQEGKKVLFRPKAGVDRVIQEMI